MKKAVEAQGMLLLAFIVIGLFALTVAFKGLDISKGLVDKILGFLTVPESEQAQYLPEALNSVEALRFAIDYTANNGQDVDSYSGGCTGSGGTYTCIYPYDKTSKEEQEKYKAKPKKVSCSGGTCTVHGFALKQDVSDASEWILGYGDPYFLVYWQEFPIGEDSWTATLGENVLRTIIVGTTADLFFKGAGKAISGQVGKYFGKAADFGDEATEAIEKYYTKFAEKYSDDIIEVYGDKIAKATGKSLDDINKLPQSEKEKLIVDFMVKNHEFVWAQNKDILNEVFSNKLKVSNFDQLPSEEKAKTVLDLIGINIKKIPDKTLSKYIDFVKKHPKLTTAVAAADFLAAYHFDNRRKYEFIPNKLAFKVALQDFKEFGVSKELSQKYTIVLNKGKIRLDNTFYLASPCEADTIKVGWTTAFCDSFQIKNDAIDCKGPATFNPFSYITNKNCFEDIDCTDSDGCQRGWAGNACKLNSLYITVEPKNIEPNFCYSTEYPTIIKLGSAIVADAAVMAGVGALCGTGAGCPLGAAIAGSFAATSSSFVIQNKWPEGVK